MKYVLSVVLLILMLVSTGCYSTSVVTGQPEGDTVVQEDWNLIFLYGLIPVGEIDVEGECPAGVAKVTTKMSFLNQVVGAITAGILTPTSVTVICAAD